MPGFQIPMVNMTGRTKVHNNSTVTIFVAIYSNGGKGVVRKNFSHFSVRSIATRLPIRSIAIVKKIIP